MYDPALACIAKAALFALRMLFTAMTSMRHARGHRRVCVLQSIDRPTRDRPPLPTSMSIDRPTLLKEASQGMSPQLLCQYYQLYIACQLSAARFSIIIHLSHM
jgi:hypothetical protein